MFGRTNACRDHFSIYRCHRRDRPLLINVLPPTSQTPMINGSSNSSNNIQLSHNIISIAMSLPVTTSNAPFPSLDPSIHPTDEVIPLLNWWLTGWLADWLTDGRICNHRHNWNIKVWPRTTTQATAFKYQSLLFFVLLGMSIVGWTSVAGCWKEEDVNQR